MKVPVRKSHYETINKNHCFRIDLYLFGSAGPDGLAFFAENMHNSSDIFL